jgi:hypothetical protein
MTPSEFANSDGPDDCGKNLERHEHQDGDGVEARYLETGQRRLRARLMSVLGGKAEVAWKHGHFRFLTQGGHETCCSQDRVIGVLCVCID